MRPASETVASPWGVPLSSESHWKVWLKVLPEKTRHIVFKSITGQLSGFPDHVPPLALPRSREEKSIWKRIFVLKFLFTFKTTLKPCGLVMHFSSYQRGSITFSFKKNHLKIQMDPLFIIVDALKLMTINHQHSLQMFRVLCRDKVLEETEGRWPSIQINPGTIVLLLS